MAARVLDVDLRKGSVKSVLTPAMSARTNFEMPAVSVAAARIVVDDLRPLLVATFARATSAESALEADSRAQPMELSARIKQAIQRSPKASRKLKSLRSAVSTPRR